jgi:hypothetical protein
MHMSTTSRLRRLLSALAPTTVAVTVALGLTTAVPAVAQQAEPPGPVNAGNTYKWGPIARGYAWEGSFDRQNWRVRGHGQVREQHGMLTLNTGSRGSVSATERVRGNAVGRWEIRLRSAQMESGHRKYRVLTELVPAGGRPQHCGGKNIALESYRQHQRRATHYVRSLPNHAYVTQKRIGLHDNQWHTFAVEVTHRRISWFVDAHVVSSERRRDARTDTPFAVRFTMKGAGDQRMNRSRMQMDWLRYWTLKRPSAKSTAAPQLHRTTYRGAC